jgi:hypothetical protein
MPRFLLCLSLSGIFVFGSTFALSLLNPLLIERFARGALQIESEHRIGEKIDRLSASRLAGFAQRELRTVDAEIALFQKAISDEVPAKLAAVVAAMLNADCTCRQRLAGYAQGAEGGWLHSLTQARERLVVVIESASVPSLRRALVDMEGK